MAWAVSCWDNVLNSNDNTLSPSDEEHVAKQFNLPMIESTSALFTLPTELRLEIYRHIFTSSKDKGTYAATVNLEMLGGRFRNVGRAGVMKPNQWGASIFPLEGNTRLRTNRPWAAVSLLCTSQQVHNEALEEYRSTTLFAVCLKPCWDGSYLDEPYGEFSPRAGAWLQCLRLDVELLPDTVDQYKVVDALEKLGSVLHGRSPLREFSVRLSVSETGETWHSQPVLSFRRQRSLVDAFALLPCCSKLTIECTHAAAEQVGYDFVRTVYSSINSKEDPP